LYSRERKNLLVEWQKGSGTKMSKMNWHCTTWDLNWKPERSIVLNELFTSEFGQKTRQNKCIIYKLVVKLYFTVACCLTHLTRSTRRNIKRDKNLFNNIYFV
jgi:hypothetical protein